MSERDTRSESRFCLVPGAAPAEPYLPAGLPLSFLPESASAKSGAAARMAGAPWAMRLTKGRRDEFAGVAMSKVRSATKPPKQIFGFLKPSPFPADSAPPDPVENPSHRCRLGEFAAHQRPGVQVVDPCALFRRPWARMRRGIRDAWSAKPAAWFGSWVVGRGS